MTLGVGQLSLGLPVEYRAEPERRRRARVRRPEVTKVRQLALFPWSLLPRPPVDYEHMVACVTLLGEPACVLDLGGEPWLAVVSVNGVRRLMMWDHASRQAAVARVVGLAREQGLRVDRAGPGHVRIGGVPVWVNYKPYEPRPEDCLVLLAHDERRTRALRADLVKGVRRWRRERRGVQHDTIWE